MFSPVISLIAVAFMAAVAIAGAMAALFLPQLANRAKTSKRIANVSRNKGKAKGRSGAKGESVVNQNKRRKQIQDTMQQLEERRKSSQKRVPIRRRISQAGLSMSMTAFWIISAVCGVIFGALAFAAGSSAYLGLAGFFAGFFGFPRWLLFKLRMRRQDAFLVEFPNAIDIIVRGIKSGLPVNDCLRIISTEIVEPVGPEFAELVEAQKMGVPLEGAMERMFERMPLAEVNFLSIVISIQQKSGGNLAEALGNLSRVLRERKKMKGKIIALSQEAKASAGILAAMPPLAMGGMYVINPDYMALMWTTTSGQGLLVMSAIWMTFGVLVMKKMINFDF